MRVVAATFRFLPNPRRPYPRLFAPILELRGWTMWVGGVAFCHLAMVGAGLRGWVCPIREVTGLPCPGCGLSTAIVHLFRGEWRECFRSHAFAPIFLVGLGVMVVVTLLPAHQRHRVVDRIARWEESTGGTVLVVGGLLIYWALRMGSVPI